MGLSGDATLLCPCTLGTGSSRDTLPARQGCSTAPRITRTLTTTWDCFSTPSWETRCLPHVSSPQMSPYARKWTTTAPTMCVLYRPALGSDLCLHSGWLLHPAWGKRREGVASRKHRRSTLGNLSLLPWRCFACTLWPECLRPAYDTRWSHLSPCVGTRSASATVPRALRSWCW